MVLLSFFFSFWYTTISLKGAPLALHHIHPTWSKNDSDCHFLFSLIFALGLQPCYRVKCQPSTNRPQSSPSYSQDYLYSCSRYFFSFPFFSFLFFSFLFFSFLFFSFLFFTLLFFSFLYFTFLSFSFL